MSPPDGQYFLIYNLLTIVYVACPGGGLQWTVQAESTAARVGDARVGDARADGEPERGDGV